MDISVVIPLYNEEESIPELFGWIERVMEANGFSHEVIFVNDGSTDRSWQVIEELKQQHPDVVKGIKFRRNYGKSPALFCGFQQAEGDAGPPAGAAAGQVEAAGCHRQAGSPLSGDNHRPGGFFLVAAWAFLLWDIRTAIIAHKWHMSIKIKLTQSAIGIILYCVKRGHVCGFCKLLSDLG